MVDMPATVTELVTIDTDADIDVLDPRNQHDEDLVDVALDVHIDELVNLG